MIRTLNIQPLGVSSRHLKSILVPLSILLAALMAMAACGGGKETTLEKLVPSGATLIASIQVDNILEDQDFDALYQAIPKDDEDPQTVGDAVAEATKELGVDLSQVQEIVIFADLSRVEESLALIAKGSFDEEAVVAALEKELGISMGTVEYKGYTLREREAEDVGDPGALTVLDQATLVLGTPEAVRLVIDTREGDLAPASGKVAEAFEALKDGLVRVALAPPPDATESLGELPLDIPLNLDFLSDLQLIAIRVDKDGDDLKSEARLDFANESTAKDAGEVVDALFTLAGTLISDEGLQKLVDEAEVSVSGRRVKITSRAGLSELSEAVKGLADGLPDLFGGLFGEEEIAVPRVVPKEPPPAPVSPAIPGPGSRVAIMESREHIPVEETAIYSTTPPTSGPHWPSSARCGFYDQELPDELLVHNLEHANVVISYHLPDPSDVVELRRLTLDIGELDNWGVVREYSDIRPTTVALTAWGVIDTFSVAGGIDSQTKDRMRQFVAAYAGNRSSPERIPCRRSSGGDFEFSDFEFSMYQGEDVLGGDRLKFSELFPSDKPLVLNFWAGLCPPCRAEMRGFQAVHDQYQGEFILLGLDIGPFVGLGTNLDARNLLRELNITYPAGYAHDSPVAQYRVTGMPTTVFLTPDGKEFSRWGGFLDQRRMASMCWVSAVLDSSGSERLG